MTNDPSGASRTPTQQLHAAGQSLWIDTITRGMLTGGDLQRYREDFTLTGLTSNPAIFAHAFSTTQDYDDAIARGVAGGRSGEDLFFDLAVEDLQAAADVFADVHRATDGLDGWVSLEVSPLLAYDTRSTIEAARDLYARAARDNLFIKIPGTAEGLPAIEETIAAGIPVNVTLLFSEADLLAAADAYLRGIERRIAAGLDPAVASVASVFISRWDVAADPLLPAELQHRLALAVGAQAYRGHRSLLVGDRVARIEDAGGRMQRLLFASTSTKSPDAPDTLYVTGLVAPGTINTMPEATVRAFADHGVVGPPLPHDGAEADAVVAAVEAAGVDVAALGRRLQAEGAEAFVSAWHQLLGVVGDRAAAVRT